MRHEFPSPVKREARERAKDENGHVRCAICLCIVNGAPHYDHRIPDALGGEPTIENCQCLCPKCHRLKTTKQDVPQIAKAKRQYDRHAGIRPSRGRKMQSRPFNFERVS